MKVKALKQLTKSELFLRAKSLARISRYWEEKSEDASATRHMLLDAAKRYMAEAKSR